MATPIFFVRPVKHTLYSRSQSSVRERFVWLQNPAVKRTVVLILQPHTKNTTSNLSHTCMHTYTRTHIHTNTCANSKQNSLHRGDGCSHVGRKTTRNIEQGLGTKQSRFGPSPSPTCFHTWTGRSYNPSSTGEGWQYIPFCTKFLPSGTKRTIHPVDLSLERGACNKCNACEVFALCFTHAL